MTMMTKGVDNIIFECLKTRSIFWTSLELMEDSYIAIQGHFQWAWSLIAH